MCVKNCHLICLLLYYSLLFLTFSFSFTSTINWVTQKAKNFAVFFYPIDCFGWALCLNTIRALLNALLTVLLNPLKQRFHFSLHIRAHPIIISHLLFVRTALIFNSIFLISPSTLLLCPSNLPSTCYTIAPNK